MADNLNQSPLAPASPVQDTAAGQGGAAMQQGSALAMAGQPVASSQPVTASQPGLAVQSAIPEQARESLPAYSNQRAAIVAQSEGGSQQPITALNQQSGGQPVASGGQPASQAHQPAQPTQPAAQAPNIPELAPVGPSFFGYKAPKWASDFEHVRSKQGKGSEHDSDTWLVTMIDRLLKKHSL
jgi:hypothetical protein